jgi:hypothetical protein
MHRIAPSIEEGLSAQLNQILKCIIVFIGNNDVLAKYRVTIKGVTPETKMSDVEQKYFNDILSSFIKRNVANYNVLEVTIDDQIPHSVAPGNRMLVRTRSGFGRSLQVEFGESGTIEVVGSIYATYPPYVAAETFGSDMQAIFTERKTVFMMRLVNDWMRPGVSDAVAGAAFFTKTYDLTGTFNTDMSVDATDDGSDLPGPNSSSGSDSRGGGGGFPLIPIVSALGALALIIAGYLAFRYYKKKRRIEQEKAELREERKKRDARRRKELERMDAPRRSALKKSKSTTEVVPKRALEKPEQARSPPTRSKSFTPHDSQEPAPLRSGGKRADFNKTLAQAPNGKAKAQATPRNMPARSKSEDALEQSKRKAGNEDPQRKPPARSKTTEALPHASAQNNKQTASTTRKKPKKKSGAVLSSSEHSQVTLKT